MSIWELIRNTSIEVSAIKQETEEQDMYKTKYEVIGTETDGRGNYWSVSYGMFDSDEIAHDYASEISAQHRICTRVKESYEVEDIKTKRIRARIEELSDEYVNESKRGFINGKWIERITRELNLKNLDDSELSDMWDMVNITFEIRFNDLMEVNQSKAIKYLDAQSAFEEVVNKEARERRGE